MEENFRNIQRGNHRYLFWDARIISSAADRRKGNFPMFCRAVSAGDFLWFCIWDVVCILVWISAEELESHQDGFCSVHVPCWNPHGDICESYHSEGNHSHDIREPKGSLFCETQVTARQYRFR